MIARPIPGRHDRRAPRARARIDLVRKWADAPEVSSLRTRSERLFHAVVVSGAALSGGCDKPAEAPTEEIVTPPPASVSAPAAPPASASAGGSASPSAKPCPEGSELPFPPCAYIR